MNAPRRFRKGAGVSTKNALWAAAIASAGRHLVHALHRHVVHRAPASDPMTLLRPSVDARAIVVAAGALCTRRSRSEAHRPISYSAGCFCRQRRGDHALHGMDAIADAGDHQVGHEIVGISSMIAIAAAIAALFLPFYTRSWFSASQPHSSWRAVCGMHYTGMYAGRTSAAADTGNTGPSSAGSFSHPFSFRRACCLGRGESSTTLGILSARSHSAERRRWRCASATCAARSSGSGYFRCAASTTCSFNAEDTHARDGLANALT